MCRKQEKRLVVLQRENSAPVTGITPCTQVGRQSETHFDIGFSVNSIPRSKMVMEPQGERVSALVLFEQSVDMSAVASVSATQLQETRQRKGLREVSCEQP